MPSSSFHIRQNEDSIFVARSDRDEDPRSYEIFLIYGIYWQNARFDSCMKLKLRSLKVSRFHCNLVSFVSLISFTLDHRLATDCK